MYISEISKNKWIEILKKINYNNFFQSSSFLELSAKYFNLNNRYFRIIIKKKDYYFCIQEDESRISYAPFIGYGGVFSNELFPMTMNFEIKKAIEKKYNTKIKRMKIFPFQSYIHSDSFYQTNKQTTVLSIKKNMEEQEKNMHKKTRTEIKYALKHNILIKKIRQNDLDCFYSIYKSTMDRVHSSYRTPKDLFKDLIKMENTLFLGAFINSKLIAASVFFYYRGGMYYWVNSSNEIGRRLSANYALIYIALNFCIDNHISFLDMASSHSKTIERPKLRWGAHTIPLVVLPH